MQQYLLTGTPPAFPLVQGDPDNPVPTLISNQDPNNTVYIGNDPSVNPNNPNAVSFISPGQYLVVTGVKNIYGICSPGLTALVYVIPEATSFFQPVTSITLPTGATSGERIFLNGTNATITGYQANGTPAYVMTPLGIFFYNASGQLVLSMVGAGIVNDPETNVACSPGFTNFEPGTPAVNINLGGVQLSFNSASQQTPAGISSSDAGDLFIFSGTVSLTDVQADISLTSTQSISESTGAPFVNVGVTGGHLAVNGTEMTVP